MEREQLIKDSTAQVLVRTALYLNNQPVPLAVLEDVTLTLTTRDKEGVSNTKVRFFSFVVYIMYYACCFYLVS